MQVLCDQGHLSQCPDNQPYTMCPVCGSIKITYIVGELKKEKKGGFGRKSDVSQVQFKKEDRMADLDKKYGRRY